MTNTDLNELLRAMRGENDPMTAAAFRAAITELGLTQQAAGVFFGRSPRVGQRWAAGNIPVPGIVALALRQMCERGARGRTAALDTYAAMAY
jgi:hypothetical protein